LITSLVVLATLALIGWSAWPVIRPARQVDVVQAVFSRVAVTQTQESQEGPARDVPTVQAPGWLEAEPFYVACTALADGVVESFEVFEGDYVEQGAVVARLVAEDSEIRLRRTEAERANAEAALGIAMADLEAAQSAWADPVELDRAVEAGRAAVAESEAEIAQLPSLIESARATLIGLVEEADRARLSTERGASNELERIISEQRAAAQNAEVRALEARGPILEAHADRLRAQLRAAERDLDLRIEDTRRLAVATAMVASAEAAVERAIAIHDEAALELERMVIRAPITGYVQSRLKVPGDKVIRMMDSPHSAHLVHMYDPGRLQVRVDVPLTDASHISVGQACEVVVEVLPDRVFRGEVLRTTHEADLQKNTLQFKVKVIDPDPILRPEMLTRVKFLSSQGGGVSEARSSKSSGSTVRIPTGAFDDAGGSGRVWIVTNRHNGRGVLSSRSVDVIERTADWLTVAGNIQPGALITVDVAKPREGEFVVVRNLNEERAPS
jgi:multidrug resistance efflux pump